MKAAVHFIALIPIWAFVLSCKSPQENRQQAINYPLPLPDALPLPFLPGKVSTAMREFGTAFSQDGKSFYFARSENSESKLHVIHYADSGWGKPEALPFMKPGYSYADPAFAPDGKFYFISNQPKGENDTLTDYDIWFVAHENNSWSTPINMEVVNSDSSEYYVSFSKEGNLYFSSSRAGGMGEEDIYVSKLHNGNYTAPQNLGQVVNTNKSEYDPFISPTEDFIIFTASGREDTFGGADLYVASIDARGEWHAPRNLGAGVNTTTRDYCAYISPDMQYFFFSSENDVKWVTANVLIRYLEN